MSDRAGDKMRKRMGSTPAVTRQAGETAASAAGETAGGPKVRITVDLERPQHRALRALAYEHETDAAKIIRALLDEVGADAELRARVIARVTARLHD